MAFNLSKAKLGKTIHKRSGNNYKSRGNWRMGQSQPTMKCPDCGREHYGLGLCFECSNKIEDKK